LDRKGIDRFIFGKQVGQENPGGLNTLPGQW
jgi:hypothetical protein